MKRIFAIAVLLLIMINNSLVVSAQNLKDKFSVVNQVISLKSGVLHLNEAEGAGIAWMKGKTFTNGVIEFDVRGKDQFQASFVGIAFGFKRKKVAGSRIKKV